MEIIRLTQNDDSTINQIAQTIQADPTLTGRTLKFANSSHAAAQRPVASVSEAIVRLGMRTVGTMALGFSVLSSSRKGSCEGFDYDQFWSKSLAMGIATKSLCGPTKAAQPEEGFACGLLSEIGRLAMASIYPEKYSEVLKQWDGWSKTELIKLERVAFATDHVELTAAMMQDWGLPDIFCNAIIAQNNLVDCNLENCSREEGLALTLQTAAEMATLCTIDENQQQKPLQDLLAYSQRISLEDQGLIELCEDVVSQWQHWGKILSVKIQSAPSFADLIERSRPEPTEDGVLAEVASVEEIPTSKKISLQVLVAEDDPSQLKLVNKLISGAGHVVIEAQDGQEALRLALETNPDVVVTDWMMPKMDGFDLCRSLRQAKFGRQLYLIIMTSNEEEERLVEAFDAGADDYVLKPLRAKPLLARLRAATRMIELQREVDEEREQTRRITGELAVANRKLEEAAFTDALTGLPNRRYLIKQLKQEWAATNRTGGPLACMLLDIDRFKSVNDTYGHDVGDLVLKKVADILHSAARENEPVFRQGGEEFVVLCPASNLAEALRGAERIRGLVEKETHGAFEQFNHSVTVSIGVAVRSVEMCDEDAFLKEADEALYTAKESGRNRVCGAGDHPVEKISKIKGTLRALFH